MKQFLIWIKETQTMMMVVAKNIDEAKRMVYVDLGIEPDDWTDIEELNDNLIVELSDFNSSAFNIQKLNTERN